MCSVVVHPGLRLGKNSRGSIKERKKESEEKKNVEGRKTFFF